MSDDFSTAPADTAAQWLQDLLDRSFASSSGHLTSIMEPGRRLSAAQVIADLDGLVVLNVATVTARGEPRVSAVDGHFVDGRWWFGTAEQAVKARHLARRSAVSASYTPRDGFGIFVHGHAQRVDPASAGFAPMRDRLLRTYGHGPEGWPEPVAFYRIDPTWMTAFAMPVAEMERFAAEREAAVREATGPST